MANVSQEVESVGAPLFAMLWNSSIYPKLQAEVAAATSPDLKLLEPAALAAINSFIVAECARLAAL